MPLAKIIIVQNFMSDRPFIIAHRGASAAAPENTVMAFLLAYMQGADGVLADVRMSGDGHLVVMGDEDTKRVSGVTMKVSKTSLEKLRSLDVGRVKTRRGQGQRMPLLEEVLGMIPEEKTIYLNLMMGTEGVDPLVKTLKAFGEVCRRVRVVSADVEMLTAVKAALPNCHTVLQCERRWTQKSESWAPEIDMVVKVAAAVGVEAVSMDVRSLAAEPEVIGILATHGIEAHVWTVNRAPGARRFAKLGVGAIISEYPGHLVASFEKAVLVSV
jgi:glycerophosphoryl diester phosphodiesterase